MTEYTVVSADLEKDRQVIIDLWRQNLADTSHLEEKYDWHFLNNPFGPGQIWILKADGHPIGTTSLGMRPLKLGETITNAGVACDLAVNKEHRFLQPALCFSGRCFPRRIPAFDSFMECQTPVAHRS